jgi:hypothetical protein
MSNFCRSQKLLPPWKVDSRRHILSFCKTSFTVVVVSFLLLTLTIALNPATNHVICANIAQEIVIPDLAWQL